MADTYSQIYLHFVFAVRNRQGLIPREHKEELHRYITELTQRRKAKLLAAHCMPDHAHLFVGFHPSFSISDFVKEIKVESTEFIRSKGWVPGSFRWQEGYGVFSYGQSQISSVCNYIANQEVHHRKTKFREEYTAILMTFNVQYEDRYLFEWLE